jgi:hypothetical protein
MEDHATTDATLALWRELRSVNAGRGDSGVVIQAALRRSPGDVEALIGESARVRLCKGAYVEPPSVASRTRPTSTPPMPADGTAPGRRRVPGHRDPRRAADPAGRGVRPGERDRPGPVRVPDALRRPARSPGTPGRAGFGVRSTSRTGRSGIRTSCAAWRSARPNVAFVLRSVLREGSGRRADLARTRTRRESKSHPWRNGRLVGALWRGGGRRPAG